MKKGEKLGAGSGKLEERSWKREVGRWKLGDGSWEMEVGKLEAGRTKINFQFFNKIHKNSLVLFKICKVKF